MSRILVVVPARGGSKGVPGKNLRELGGFPLIVHALRTAKASRHAPRIMVSTDSDEIAATAREEGVDVPFMRPDHLSGDEVSLISPVKHAMEWHDAKGWRPDIVVSLQGTAPFTPASALDEALDCLVERRHVDSAVSVAKVTKPHPFRTYDLEADGQLKPLTEYTTERYLQKQDRPDAYYFTGGFFVRRRGLLEDWAGDGFALGKVMQGVLVSPEQAVDIDTPLDFLVAQAILQQREQQGAC